MISAPKTITLKVENQKGIHARVAAKIVSTADFHNIEATLSHKGMTVPLGSIMGLLLLSARKGSVVILSSEHKDPTPLFNAMETLFLEKFDED